MKKVAIFLAALLSAMIVTNEGIANQLDQPGEKQITVRSEILRGYRSGPESGVAVIDIMDQYHDILKINEQQGKDSEGFILGWSLSYLIRLDLALSLSSSTKLNNEESINLGKKTVKGLRQDIQKLEGKFGINDQKLCEEVEIKYDATRPILERWN